MWGSGSSDVHAGYTLLERDQGARQRCGSPKHRQDFPDAVTDEQAALGGFYHDLFRRLVELRGGKMLYNTVAYFFAAQYFCTDNVPKSIANVYFGIAFAQSVDLGLNR